MSTSAVSRAYFSIQMIHTEPRLYQTRMTKLFIPTEVHLVSRTSTRTASECV